MTRTVLSAPPASTLERPLRIGFVGLGWIGLNRCQALLRSGLAELTCFVDSDDRACQSAGELHPQAARTHSLRELLQCDLDGVVIATPSALHAEQTLQALEAGCAVFCQKPLARDAAETRSVVEAARRADRRLGVDFCYRHLRATRAVRSVVESGKAGRLYACDLTFHNAYGPDKDWYYRREESGGGCLIDLGIHLVDLAMELLGETPLQVLSARMRSGGESLRRRGDGIEDYVTSHLETADGCDVRLACSWNLSAGCDARIGVDLYGTRGGASLHNIDGSFYNFQAERFQRTQRVVIERPPDDWAGGAIVEWARGLAEGGRYDARLERAVRVARVLDDIYEAAGNSGDAYGRA